MLYSNGCTDDGWAVVVLLLQPMGKVGRPREHDPRMLWNTIQYIAVTGCQWAQLPKEFLIPCRDRYDAQYAGRHHA
ncbi:transposase [Brucella sp. 09RB8471]|uniref:transposase n=1 Tax=Brucella sp. 09RB8471 TaxID=1149952 RepID=UPI00349EBBFA